MHGSIAEEYMLVRQLKQTICTIDVMYIMRMEKFVGK